MFSMIWQLVSLSTFWCVGVYMNSDEGGIFYFLRTITVKSPERLRKPVIGCVNCMASIHTAIVMALYFWLTGIQALWWQYIVIWLIVAVIAAGTNGIVYRVYKWFELYTDAMEQQEIDTKAD